MDKKTVFLLISTLVVGMFSGAYLYVTVFAPAYQKDLPSASTDPNVTVIEGQESGSCGGSNTCPSFRLTDDGSYDYLKAPGAKVQHNALPGDLSKKIFSQIGNAQFFEDAKPLASSVCSTDSIANNFSYTVTFKTKQYILDTCTTAFARDAYLQSLLIEVWPQMENPTVSYPPLVQKGFLGYVFYIFQHPATSTKH